MRTRCFGAATRTSAHLVQNMAHYRRDAPGTHTAGTLTWDAHEMPRRTNWRILSPSAQLIVDPASGARGIIRDTGIDGAYRFHWSVIPSGEPLPIAAGRVGGLARARSIAKEALRAYAAEFRMHTEATCPDPLILERHPGC
jgi:hypothetical protein